MLNKSVCKKCKKKDRINKWNTHDDTLWRERGVVLCLKGDVIDVDLDRFALTTFEPPEGCPYALEHLMKESE